MGSEQPIREKKFSIELRICWETDTLNEIQVELKLIPGHYLVKQKARPMSQFLREGVGEKYKND